ncbi:MAG: T9SS type A sorting domain-containing protein [Candidatus Cloacimonetes bacterium]|nr:T9SS type A sorting domain-containing protein [Candidatus Cloacimonadota bacterium]
MKKMMLIVLFVFLGISLFATSYNTITINGTKSGWDSDEDFTDCSSASYAYLTWDENYFYFAISDPTTYHENLATFMYFDTDPDGPNGSTNAYAWINNITTPFRSDWVVVWKNQFENDRIEVWQYNICVWNLYGVAFSNNYLDKVNFACDFDASSNYREVRVKRSMLGVSSSTDKISFCSFTERQLDSYWRFFAFPSQGWTNANRAANQSIGHYRGYTLGSGYSPDDAGSYDQTLPVILSSFTVQYLNNTPTLYWITQSETDNIGWYIYRNNENDFSSAGRITNYLISGYGTTTEQHSYLYKDNDLIVHSGDIYWYWIQNIDFGGQINTYDPHKLIIPNIEPEHYEPEIPIEYRLQSSPNPANFSTTISFTINKSTFAEVSIYNILGELVKTLPMVVTTEDEKATVYWNGKDENGKVVKDGIYLYQLNVDGKPYKTNKLILLR